MTTKKEIEPKKVKGRLKNALLNAYDKSMGNISSACRTVNVSRETFYRFKREDPVFAERVTEIDESNLDFAETVLLKNIREGKETSLIFFLKTKGRDRGYVERVENDITINPFLELMKSVDAEED
ncbi:MAG: hypothetical protein PHD45_08065 [Bacteroidales bacterium]|nr:hypothetical protein [Bacteroidales bacterium]